MANSSIIINGIMKLRGGRGGFSIYNIYGISDEYNENSEWNYHGGGGSGGGIRLVCDTLCGQGQIDINGGFELGRRNTDSQCPGGLGRVRVEANTISFALPSLVTISTAAPSSPVKLWPDAAIKNVSLGGVSVPSDPQSTGGMNALTPSMAFNAAGNRELLVETTNLATTATVRVRVAPTIGDGERFFDAACISGDITRATWKATISLAKGTSVIQVLASDVTLNP